MSKQKVPSIVKRGGLMANPIAIEKLRAAARKAVLAGIPVRDCPPEFKLVEQNWRAEYWFAHYQITCENADE